MDNTIIVAVVGAIAGLIATLITIFGARRFGIPTNLEDRLVKLLKEANSELEDKVARLEKDKDRLQKELTEEKAMTSALELRVDQLERQNRRQQDELNALEGKKA